jgi:AraC-like DNA-binding protein
MPRGRTLINLCRAKDFIRDAFAESIELEDVALEADLSAWHLLRRFRQAFGETPHEFLTRLRIEKAKELLTLSDRPVTEICFDVGFSSLGSFSTLFAKKVGVSPLGFRRQVRTLVTMPGYPPWAFVPFCFSQVYSGRFLPLSAEFAK